MAGRKFEVVENSTTVRWIPLLAAAISIAGIIVVFVGIGRDDYEMIALGGVMQLAAMVWAVLGLLEDRE